MPQLAVIAHNMRSTHNVGSLFRTADGLGIAHLALSGYTAYPVKEGDKRLPHIAKKLDAQIHKTALGAEKSILWTHFDTLEDAISFFSKKHFRIVALEQDQGSTSLNEYKKSDVDIALVLGTERDGLTKAELTLCDESIEIPMKGIKESFNVVQAAAIALYVLSYPT